VDSEAAWLAGLRAAHVEPDPRRRTETIASEARRLAASVGGALVEDADLLAHVAGLVEWPTPLLGTFDPAYLDIPAQVIVELMRVHQKYFAVRDAAGGLSNHFVCVAGTAVKDPAVVAAGNQRVLAARLSDGRFFWTSDQRRPLASYVDDLAQRTFLKGLGTMRDKALRLEVLARKLAEALYGGGGGDGAGGDAAARAGLLAKADLATGLVGEFPELQGEMGAEYARLGADPEPAAVATAIAEHYRPRFAGDALPATPAGAAVALADKLDSIVGCFCLGLEPTGSADPYALRRQALGVIHVLSALPQGGSPLGLGACLDLAREAYADVVAGDWPAVRARVLDFFRARLKALLADEFPTDLTEAVLEAGCDAPGAVRGRLTALSAVKRSAGWEDLAAAVKRVVRIVADQAPGALDPATLTEPAERALYEAFVGVERATVAALAAGRYDDALGRLVSLKPAIDGFFDAIMVMSDDPGERGRRLALLGGIAGLFRQVAAFDRVST
jgi:glycyl-tRNA synthetase beta chain